MANLAKIQSIAQGQFFVKDSLGNLTELKVGNTVSLNDTIVAASSNTDLSKIEILFDTNELITLSQGEQLLDATLLASTFGNEELAFDKQEVDETLNAWNNAQDGDETDMETAAGDVTEQATNAGDERAADGGALRSKFNSRDGALTNVESDLRDISFGGGNTEEPQEQIPTELLNPVGATTPTTPVDTRVPASVITIKAPANVDENATKVTYTLEVDNAPQTDLIVTVKVNGVDREVTILKDTKSVTFDVDVRADDKYVQTDDTITATITGHNGGNYEDVKYDNTDNQVTVTDDNDTVTVKLTATETTTEGGKITYTVTLVDKDGNPVNTKTGVTVELSNGQTIIIDANSSSNSKEINAEKDDVYVDAKDVSVSIKEVTETNNGAENSFENLVADKTPVRTKVTDTTDTVKVNVTAKEVNNGKDIELTLSLTNEDGMVTNVTDELLTVVVADSLGNKYPIEIPIGSNLSKPITVPNPIPEGGNVIYFVTVDKESITGGNYEALEGSNTSITTKDIVPPTIFIKAEPVTEANTGKVTGDQVVGQVTIWFNKPLTEDLTVTLKNGQKVEFKVGDITKTVDVDTSRVDDAYKQGETNETISIKSTSNPDIDVTDKKATITIQDDEDPTTVTITGTDTSEGGKATFEIQLSNPPQKGVPLETVIADFTGRINKQNELINDGWKIEGDGSMAVGKYDGKTGSSERLLIRDQNDGNDNPTTVTSPTFKIVEGDSGKVSFNFYGSNYNSKDNSFTWKVEKLDTKTGKWEVVQEETISKSISSGGEQLVTTNSLGGGEYRVVYEVKTGEDNKHYKGTENEKSANYGVYIDNVKVTTEKTTGKVQVGDKTYDVVFDENGKATLKVPVKGNDHYIGEPTLTAKVIEVNGGNYEKVDLNTTEKIIVKDTKDTTKVTITAVQTTDKVIDIKNLQNNAGFTVKAKDPYGKEAKISTHGNPSGFGVESEKETTSGKLGQTNQVYSGHTSEIGVVKDGDTYKSESIEVVFKNPIQTLDVAFAWRHNGERAKVDFYNGDTKVGYAIVKGGGSNTDAIVEYYIGDETTPHTTVKAQGGTDKVDLVYTFKPAGDVTFTKAVFSADGAGSDYLIHSIKYKEAVGGDNTTVVGSQEVAFKIETSVKPDPIWIAKGNTPTAYVKIVDNTGKVEFEGPVNLDKDGKSIVTVRTDGNVNFTATVTDVKGNFEYVNYDENSVTITGSLLPTASNDSITTNEDTPYTLTKDDFGNIGNTTNTQNVAKIKFDSLPANGTIYVLKTEYTASMNDRAEYTISESNDKVYIKLEAGDIVDISQINKGNVIFVPNKDTDDNGEFKFKVSSGGISDSSFKGDYTTTIDVKAVADAPEVSVGIKEIKIPQDNEPKGNDKNLNHGSKKTIDFEGVSNKVSINVDLNGNGNTSGKINFYSNGVLISSQSLINGDYVYELEAGKYFDKFELEHTGNSSGSNNGAIHLNKWSLEAESNKYEIEYSVKLTDGSEKLSDFIIKNLPEGSKLFGAVLVNKDGSYTVKVDETGKAKLTLESQNKLSEDDLNSIKASATSNEVNEKGEITDSATTTVSQNFGKDIDLSGLKSILKEQETGDIDLSKNGSQDKLTLTLDDVLKLSGDDKQIKITGDQFDSVTFKNTIGEDGKENAWSKTASDEGFDIYVNSGDESLKVKVEQPISDGITN